MFMKLQTEKHKKEKTVVIYWFILSLEWFLFLSSISHGSYLWMLFSFFSHFFPRACARERDASVTRT